MKKLKQIWVLPAAILLLSTAMLVVAEPPEDYLYRGGGFDGFDSGTGPSFVLGQQYYIFLGSGYDGFDYGFITNNEIPRLPGKGTLVIIQ